jgi:hypothetical protein
MLEAWWGQLEPDAKFARVPLSGGWGDPQLRAGFQASGDVMTTSPRFPWSVEVKRREGWVWKNLIASKKSPVWKWWRQAEGQALEMGKEPLMFFRHNNERWHIMQRGATQRGINQWNIDRSKGNRVALAEHPIVISYPDKGIPNVQVDLWDLAQHELLEYGRQRLGKAGRKR